MKSNDYITQKESILKYDVEPEVNRLFEQHKNERTEIIKEIQKLIDIVPLAKTAYECYSDSKEFPEDLQMKVLKLELNSPEKGSVISHFMDIIEQERHMIRDRGVDKNPEEAIKDYFRKYVKEGVEETYKQASSSYNQKIILGRTEDTGSIRTQSADTDKGELNAQRILNTGKWSLPANDSFIGAAVDNSYSMRIVSDMSKEARDVLSRSGITHDRFLSWIEKNKDKPDIVKNLWDKDSNRVTVLARELAQVIKANKHTFEHGESRKGKYRTIARPKTETKDRKTFRMEKG